MTRHALAPALMLLLLAPALAGCLETAPGATLTDLKSAGCDLAPTGSGPMTAKVSPESNSTWQDGSKFRAERLLCISGILTLDAIPVTLEVFNGPITVEGGPDGSYQVVLRLRAEGATEREAVTRVESLRYDWSHESDGAHRIRATVAAPPSTSGYSASLVVVVPASTLLTLDAETMNGPITLTGLRTESASVKTANGPITADLSGEGVSLKTSNGPITLMYKPLASGDVVLDTTNGAITASLGQGVGVGYSATAKTLNGPLLIDLQGARAENERGGTVSAKTPGYDTSAIKVRVDAETVNGPVTLRGS